MHSRSAASQAGADPSPAAADALAVRMAPEPDLAALGAEWRALQASCEHSFFQSWGWIGSLLHSTGRTPLVLRVSAGDRLVGLSAWFPTPVALPWQRRLALSQLGDERYDSIYIEYNGPLAARDCAAAVRASTLAALHAAAVPGRDRIVLGGVPADHAAEAAAAGWAVQEQETKEVFCLELDSLQAPDDHLASLGRNVRHQIRRSLRFYGDVRLSPAADVEQALDFLRRLEALHQASWRQRGRPGAFAEPFFATFHRRLILDNFAQGHVEVVRVAAGADEDIGYLYNFIYGDRVYFYQSGLRYLPDNHARPGLTSHHLCIAEHAAAGRKVYDFMAGEQRYKTDLGARPAGRLSWIELRRPLTDLLRR